jgi:uncharacterized protein (TIGR02678 family)
MSGHRGLDPDLREVARRLIAECRIRAEVDPEAYRGALRGRRDLSEFFRGELGWTLEFREVAEMVRLHKRRADVPDDRGPLLHREGKSAPLAPARVLVLAALACEQLWRRPRMSLRELSQAIAQVCAGEAPTGHLPWFRIVAADGTPKSEARQNRLHLVDALRLLVGEGTVAVDADLDRAADDEDIDLVVTATRERLAVKFSALSPTLLGLADLPPDRHAKMLSAQTLPDLSAADEPHIPSLEDRRLLVLRRVVDDPATNPLDDHSPGSPYLHSLTGRERGLEVAASLGLAVTVRRDWWEVVDPSGDGSAIDFPNGRRTERQAALALLEYVGRRADPMAPLSLAEITELFTSVRTQQTRWAMAYDRRLNALAAAAAAELVAVGLLNPDPGRAGFWQPTPGIHLWRIRVHRHERSNQTGEDDSRGDDGKWIDQSH